MGWDYRRDEVTGGNSKNCSRWFSLALALVLPLPQLQLKQVQVQGQAQGKNGVGMFE